MARVCTRSSSKSCLKAVFGVLVLLGFIFLLLINGVLENDETGEARVLSPWPVGSSKKVVGGSGSKKLRRESDLNYYVSKRRVPNGSDPIHNRRAGNSQHPPGQA